MKKAEIILGASKVIAEVRISDEEGYEKVARMDYLGSSKKAILRTVEKMAAKLSGMGYEPWFDGAFWEETGAYDE